MRAKSVIALGGLLAAVLSLSSCIVGVGDWERYNKDFHSSYPLKAGGRLSVETFNGSVDISGWDQDTVDISGTKYGPSQEEADNLRVDIDHSADSVSIHVQRPTDRRNNQGARLTIKIPRGTQPVSYTHLTEYPAPRARYWAPRDSKASGRVAAGQATQRSDNERMRRKGKPPGRGAETASGDFIMSGTRQGRAVARLGKLKHVPVSYTHLDVYKRQG